MFSSVLLLFGFAFISQSSMQDNVDPRQLGNFLSVIAKSGEIPYQVIILRANSRSIICGGALLNSLYVITAAHCVNKRHIKDIVVSAGRIYLRNATRRNNRNRRTIKEIIIHEQYNIPQSCHNDIALLRLNTAYVQTRTIGYAILPEMGANVMQGQLVRVSGYGIISERVHPQFHRLLKANTLISIRLFCKVLFQSIQYNILDTQICVNDPYRASPSGSRTSDAGGPLVVDNILIGIASCVEDVSNAIVVFTRISSYIPWIDKHINSRRNNDYYSGYYNVGRVGRSLHNTISNDTFI